MMGRISKLAPVTGYNALLGRGTTEVMVRGIYSIPEDEVRLAGEARDAASNTHPWFAAYLCYYPYLTYPASR